MARVPYSDGCPTCLTRGHLPIVATPTRGGQMVCRYRCPAGHLWRTSWLISAVEGTSK